MRALRVVVGAACMMIACASDGHACFCATSPTCAAFWRADAVFIGRVTKIEALPPRQELGPRGLVTLSVVHAFRGAPSAEVTLQQYGSDCDLGFRAYETYLVFADRQQDGGLSTGICSGTKLLPEANADLATVETLPSLPPVGWVYGTVVRTVRASTDNRARSEEPAEGIVVAIAAGATRLQGRTDASGSFEIRDVPPGSYKARAVVPGSISTWGGGPIDVPARGCARVKLGMVSNGRISGRLRLADGTPVRGAPIALRLVDVEGSKRGVEAEWHPQWSDPQGRFAFEGILPGHYYLGVNVQSGASRQSPYSPRYYRDVADPSDAYVIDLGEGEVKTGFDFTLTRLDEGGDGFQPVTIVSAPETPGGKKDPVPSPLFPPRALFRIVFPIQSGAKR